MAEPVCISLEYKPNLKEIYQNFNRLPGFVLLESADQSRGRYDILSAFPYQRIKIDRNTSNASEELNQLSQSLTTEPSIYDLPFQGGAIGFFSYDLADILSGLKTTAQESLSSMPLADFGLYDWAIIIDHRLKKVTLFAANRHSDTKEIAAEMFVLWQKPIVKDKLFTLKTQFAPVLTKKRYKEDFHTIKKALKEGRCYQVNYTQPFNGDYEGDSWSIYKRISQNNPVPYAAFISGDSGNILSFSPERFILLDQGQLFTSPIKGTSLRSEDPVVDDEYKKQLVESIKNRAENVMIVDLLRNDFGKIAKTGSVRVPHLFSVESYNAVHHLVSEIRAECKEGIKILDAFLSCFPGGSITGAPKLEAMKVINETEQYGRGVYCGNIGYFSHHGRFDTNIAIRTILASQQILHLAAGGGIVIDSECEDEYLECFTKITAIINGLR